MNIRGRIDRVDSVVFTDEVVEQLNESGLFAESAEELPLIFDGKEPPAKRFIIIRDIKTIEGPKPGQEGYAMLLDCSRKFNLLSMHVLGRLHILETE